MEKNKLDRNSTTTDLKSVIIDSNGKTVDTSICKDFLYQFPTYNSLPNQDNYGDVKNKTNGDVFKITDSLFYDRCISLTLNDTLDIPVIYRRELYDSHLECNNNCKYSGINEFGYINCLCGNLIKNQTFSLIKIFLLRF